MVAIDVGMNGTLNSSGSMDHQHGEGKGRATISMGRASNQLKEGMGRVVVGVGRQKPPRGRNEVDDNLCGEAMTGVRRVDN